MRQTIMNSDESSIDHKSVTSRKYILKQEKYLTDLKKMYSPEKQQIEICLLKSNLEEIENNLIEQRSAIPALDAENEKKYNETMTALRTVRSLNKETERLNQESVRLTARRTQVSRQCDDVRDALNAARSRRSSLERAVRSEEDDKELLIRRYEDALRDIADRFRKSRAFYNENEIKSEIEIIKSTNEKLRNEEEERLNEVAVLKNKLEELKADIPEDILAIMGKTELENELKELSVECEALRLKRDNLLKNRLTTSLTNLKY